MVDENNRNDIRALATDSSIVSDDPHHSGRPNHFSGCPVGHTKILHLQEVPDSSSAHRLPSQSVRRS